MDLQNMKRPAFEKQVNIRMQPAELQEFKSFAARQGCSFSEFLRYSAAHVMREAAAQEATPAAE